MNTPNPGLGATFRDAAISNNPAWVQMLGLCPMLAVSSSVANALGLALASTLVLVGSSTTISALRRLLPAFARLPAFVLVIATFTTVATLLMQAYAFELYLSIALFVQIIVTNCMILGRAESFASRQPVGRALADALGTAAGFAIALVGLGAVRELLATGTLLAGMDRLFGPAAAGWSVTLHAEGGFRLAAMPPGAFIVAGLLLAMGNAVVMKRTRKQAGSTAGNP